MNSYKINVAKIDTKGSYRHYFRIELDSSYSIQDAMERYNAIVTAFPYPTFYVTLGAYSVPIGHEICNSNWAKAAVTL